MLAGDTVCWHNADLPLDTNGDGQISPRDALAVFQAINAGHAGELSESDSFDAIRKAQQLQLWRTDDRHGNLGPADPQHDDDFLQTLST